jgi:hypothetical protein
LWPSVRTLAQDDSGNGLQEQFDVQPKILAFDVLHIELNLLRERNVAATTDLPAAGQARDDTKPLAISQGVLCHFLWDRRSGADLRHISPEHVSQLWQLINAKLPDSAANPRDPQVALHFKGNAALVVRLAQERVIQRLCIDDHRAKFGKWKLAPPTSDTWLLEEHWAPIGEFN